MLLVLLLAAAGGGAVLFGLIRNGAISQHQIMNMIGQGTGELSIANLSDDTLSMELAYFDPQTTSPTVLSTNKLKSFEVHGAGQINPGRYRLTITAPTGKPGSGVCSLKISSGDAYQITVVRTGALISNGRGASGSADLAFPTSPLCQQ